MSRPTDKRVWPSVGSVAILLSVLLVASCSEGGPAGSGAWRLVQSGTDAAVSWSLFRTELQIPAVRVTTPCLALETQPHVAQKYGVPPNGVYPKTHAGKSQFCGLPAIANTTANGGGFRFKLLVVGSNLDPTAGAHDVFGSAYPELTGLTATFSDGTTAEGHIKAESFVLLWSGPKALAKLTAFAGATREQDCFPPGKSEYLSLTSEDQGAAPFTCSG